MLHLVVIMKCFELSDFMGEGFKEFNYVGSNINTKNIENNFWNQLKTQTQVILPTRALPGNCKKLL